MRLCDCALYYFLGCIGCYYFYFFFIIYFYYVMDHWSDTNKWLIDWKASGVLRVNNKLSLRQEWSETLNWNDNITQLIFVKCKSTNGNVLRRGRYIKVRETVTKYRWITQNWHVTDSREMWPQVDHEDAAYRSDLCVCFVRRRKSVADDKIGDVRRATPSDPEGK